MHGLRNPKPEGRNPKSEPLAKVKGRKMVAEEFNQGIHSSLVLGTD
jgi:hypothetical protein